MLGESNSKIYGQQVIADVLLMAMPALDAACNVGYPNWTLLQNELVVPNGNGL